MTYGIGASRTNQGNVLREPIAIKARRQTLLALCQLRDRFGSCAGADHEEPDVGG
jgi:hypothetical protein